MNIEDIKPGMLLWVAYAASSTNEAAGFRPRLFSARVTSTIVPSLGRKSRVEFDRKLCSYDPRNVHPSEATAREALAETLDMKAKTLQSLAERIKNGSFPPSGE